jgi:hypothetical protein
MRWNRICGIGAWALLIGLAAGSTALAQAVTHQREAKAREKAELVQELRAAHKLLTEADHDYDGHRARAAEAVHRAIKELAGNHHPKKVPAAAGTAGVAAAAPVAKKKSAVREPQAASDAQLHQAQTILLGLQPELNARHPKAAVHVTSAISEINTALKIK